MELTYGLLGSKLVHVDKVDNGLNSGCICPICKEDLIAKNKGLIRNHHFAHQKNAECRATNETVYHLMAKNIFLEHKKLFLPSVFATIDGFKTNVLVEEGQIKIFKEVRLEERIEGIIADAIAYDVNKEPFIIEFKVTHGIDEEKCKKIKFLKMNTLEIDLTSIPIPDEDHMLEALTQKGLEVEWIHHKKANSIGEKIKESAEKRKPIYRGLAAHIDYCPINKRDYYGKSYANMNDDCFNCKFNLHQFKSYNGDYILCNGKIKTYEALKNIKKVNKEDDWIHEIIYHGGKSKLFKKNEPEIKSLYDIWKDIRKPFLAKNTETKIAVYINQDPLSQEKKYNIVRGRMYMNGEFIRTDKIFGAKKKQWFYIKKQLRSVT